MTINKIEDSELSSIVFIRDYIQFVFEGRNSNYTLTMYTLPKLYLNNTTYEYGLEGYCDSICKFINKKVIKTVDKESDSIKIFFEDVGYILISLKDEDYLGPEAAMLTYDDISIIW